MNRVTLERVARTTRHLVGVPLGQWLTDIVTVNQQPPYTSQQARPSA